jgi:hypothetical protein
MILADCKLNMKNGSPQLVPQDNIKPDNNGETEIRRQSPKLNDELMTVMHRSYRHQYNRLNDIISKRLSENDLVGFIA